MNAVSVVTPVSPSRFSALDIKAALTSPPPALDFVVAGILSGSVGLLVSPGGVGKSNFALQLSIAVAVGEAFANGAFPPCAKPGRVVYFSGEDGPDIVRNRLHTIAGHVNPESSAPLFDHKARDWVERLCANFGVCFVLGKPVNLADSESPDIDAIKEVCQGARLVVFDTLRRFHRGDENSSGDMTLVLQVLEGIAREVGCAILVLHHANKAATFNNAGDSANATRGSSALTDNVRWQANLVKMSENDAKAYGIPDEDRSLYVKLEVVKANYVAPSPAIWLKRLSGGYLTLAELKPGALMPMKGAGKRITVAK